MTAEDDITGLRYVSWIERQAGVLAWLPGTDPVEFAVVTSRRTGRWVFPKGGIDPGMTPQEAAAQEAYEEAGLIGDIYHAPVGSYLIPKIRPPLIWAVEVELYPMRVTEIMESWLEQEERDRQFLPLDRAREMMAEPEMISVAERFIEDLGPA